MGKVRTRFAPSPTGFLHLGGARTAAFNWALARKEEGDFVLRIEDTDRERSKKQFEEAILEDLRWLGIEWDEGPDRGGPYAPYRQSERGEIYQSFIAQLKAENLIYPCYCTVEELEEERKKALKMGKAPRYSGRCFFLSPEERKEKEERGIKPSWRFRVPRGKEIVLEDLVRGKVVFHTNSLGDFIVLKSDGVPTYNFACVIDDALMDISHVLRGEEHLSNTPYQILLYQALELTPPLFAHVPIILDEERTKLSKRRGEVSVRFFREEGFLPEAILNHLLTLGHSFPDGREIVEGEELYTLFSLERIGKGGAIFDLSHLNWWNKTYIRRMDIRELEEKLTPWGGEEIREFKKELGEERFYLLLDLVREESVTLKEIAERLRDYISVKEEKVEDEEKLQVLKFLLSSLNDFPVPWEEEEVKKNLRRWQKESGFPPSIFYPVLRWALIGAEEGPELDRLLVALGREKVLEKIKAKVGDNGNSTV